MSEYEAAPAISEAGDAGMDVFELLQHGPVETRGPVCIMGVNGAGKSRFLRNLHEQLTLTGRSTFHVPAHREFAAGWNGSWSGNTTREPYNLLQHGRQDGESADLPSLINQALARAQQLDSNTKANFIANVADWIESGEQQPKPEKPNYLLTRLLDDLGVIIGRRLVTRQSHLARGGHFELLVAEDDVTYPVSSLSSGERQILLFAILSFQSASEHVAIFVDEPELHLNESRAIEMWSALEAKLPAATFVYATHSLNFATRPEVKHLFIIESGQQPVEISPNSMVPSKVIKDLVGARVQIRRTDTIPILCEDDGQSLLLKDILPSRFEPITVNSRDTVIRAVSSQLEYGRILPYHPIKLGLIDRDYASDEEIVALENRGILTLPYNEFESCLMHPSLALEYLRISNNAVTDAHYGKALLAAAGAALPETLQKLKATIESDHKPTIKHQLSNGELSAKIDPPSDAVGQFIARGNILLKAINERDLELILRTFKGKALYKHFRKQFHDIGVDLYDPYQLYRTMREIPKLKAALVEVPGIKELTEKLVARSQG